jgi:hypothetical protein
LHYIQSLYDSIPRRIRAVMRYWVVIFILIPHFFLLCLCDVAILGTDIYGMTL